MHGIYMTLHFFWRETDRQTDKGHNACARDRERGRQRDIDRQPETERQRETEIVSIISFSVRKLNLTNCRGKKKKQTPSKQAVRPEKTLTPLS